jgi:Protein of unknown function (DUF3224)
VILTRVTTTTHARSAFTIDSWEQQTWDDQEGATLARARVTKTFTGDIEGTSVAEILLAHAQVEESRAYVGFERITASIDGRSGTFVLHHNAGAEGVSWSILPDSGAGELRGIRGKATIEIGPDGGHSIDFEYELT